MTWHASYIAQITIASGPADSNVIIGELRAWIMKAQLSDGHKVKECKMEFHGKPEASPEQKT